jgi:2-polyprenyl-3-methyl-5-hydroxy-6-metoxy-1,4-benzoquinol methylase
MSDFKLKDLSPQITLLEMAEAYRVSIALKTIAELGIADLLKDSAKTCKELAQATATHESSLYRLLRAMISKGIFRENHLGCFENTPLSEALCTDAPNSVRDSVRFISVDGNIQAWMRLSDVIKTGNPSYQDATGFNSWEYRQHYPEIGELFNRHMSIFTSDSDQILNCYDFSAFKSIVDIGGGIGVLLQKILEFNHEITGILFDIPSVIKQAITHFKESEITNRIELIEGDFFKKIPSGYDAYILKHVLHNWSDYEVCQILERCREAIPDQGKLIILETIMPHQGNKPDPSQWADLHMMVTLGGRERTEKEYNALLSQANFKLTQIRNIPNSFSELIEAIPICL